MSTFKAILSTTCFLRREVSLFCLLCLWWQTDITLDLSHQIPDAEKCDQMYESLARINGNVYRQRVSTYQCSLHTWGFPEVICICFWGSWEWICDAVDVFLSFLVWETPASLEWQQKSVNYFCQVWTFKSWFGLDRDTSETFLLT